MRTVLQVLKTCIVGLLRFGIAYAVLFYVGHFNELQSIILTIVALCAIDAYRMGLKAVTNTQPKFEPFWVSIEPNWYELCRDFGLFDVERWRELQAKCDGERPEYSVLRNGFNFTMLSPTLFYSNDHQTFFGELDFRMPIEELRPAEHAGPPPFAPRCYVKQILAGAKGNLPAIEFGIITEASLKKSSHPADHEADMPVARLPEIVFYGYTHSEEYWNRTEKIQTQMKDQLTEFGWTQKEHEPEDSWLNCPFEINHKYVRVTYRGIS